VRNIIIIINIINKFKRKYYIIQYIKRARCPSYYYLDLKHCELEQCNGSSALARKSCKSNDGGVVLSFYWDPFDTECIVEEKMVTSSFGGAALGVNQARALT
jgi:hypothetical protein